MSECPVCQSQLRSPPAGWHADSHCSSCGGVWISATRLESTLQKWDVSARFIEQGPSADFCPECGPVPMDDGTLLGQRGLVCGSCYGVFLRKPLREPRSTTQEISSVTQTTQDEISTSLILDSDPPRPFMAPDEEYDLDESDDSSVTDQPFISAPALMQMSHQVPTQAPPKTSKVPTEAKMKAKAKRTAVLLGLRDLIWFGGLAVAIIASLIYWMNP